MPAPVVAQQFRGVQWTIIQLNFYYSHFQHDSEDICALDVSEQTAFSLTNDGRPVASPHLKKTYPTGDVCVVVPQRPLVCVSALGAWLEPTRLLKECAEA